jgi:hypothetical protein
MPGALAESTQDVRPVLRVVRLGARVGIDEPCLQGPIDENRELARSGGDRLGLADAERDTSVKRAERGLGPTEVHGGESEDGRRPVRGRLGATAQEATTRHLVVGREGEPGEWNRRGRRTQRPRGSFAAVRRTAGK